MKPRVIPTYRQRERLEMLKSTSEAKLHCAGCGGSMIVPKEVMGRELLKFGFEHQKCSEGMPEGMKLISLSTLYERKL